MGDYSVSDVPLTISPEDEPKVPHYYRGTDPTAHIYSTLVYHDDIPLDYGILGVEPNENGVFIDFEAEGQHTELGVGVHLEIEEVENLITSLEQFRDFIDGGAD